MSTHPDNAAAQPPVSPGVVFNPSSGGPHASSPYAGSPYAGHPHGGAPYAGDPYAGYPYAGYPYAPAWAAPRHRSAGTSLALGLIALLGALPFLGLTLFVAPFAWATGHRTLRQIRQSGGRLGGEGDARAGLVLGVIGTVLLALYLAAIVMLVLWWPHVASELEAQPVGTAV